VLRVCTKMIVGVVKVDGCLDEAVNVDIAGATWVDGNVDYLFQTCGKRDGIAE
jgi:hypothetical protein